LTTEVVLEIDVEEVLAAADATNMRYIKEINMMSILRIALAHRKRNIGFPTEFGALYKKNNYLAIQYILISWMQTSLRTWRTPLSRI